MHLFFTALPTWGHARSQRQIFPFTVTPCAENMRPKVSAVRHLFSGLVCKPHQHSPLGWGDNPDTVQGRGVGPHTRSCLHLLAGGRCLSPAEPHRGGEAHTATRGPHLPLQRNFQGRASPRLCAASTLAVRGCWAAHWGSRLQTGNRGDSLGAPPGAGGVGPVLDRCRSPGQASTAWVETSDSSGVAECKDKPPQPHPPNTSPSF